jgi:LysR family hydrogen peroxide-inducible transcriptional activator
MRITLKQLRYFDALARHGHFGRAAEACSVTQPALSMQIQDLEAEIGTPLLERARSGVILTESGRDVAERARRILAGVHDLTGYAQRRSMPFTGALHVGIIPSVAPYLLPPLLPKLRTTYPDIELHLRETQTSVLLTELADGRLDIVLLALPAEHPDLETAPLFEDRFVLALPPDHDGAARMPRVPAKLIEGERLLLLEEGHCFREQALSYCRLQQVSGINTFGASSLSTLVRLVANGHGITLLPEICLATELRGGDVQLVRFDEPEPRRLLGLAWRNTTPRREEFLALGRLIAELHAEQAWGDGFRP